MRLCSLCMKLKPFTDFGKHKNGRDGLRSRCKSCNRLEANQSYQKNPAPYKRRARAFRKKSSAEIKGWLRSVKGKYGCVCCGEREVCVLDFHHLVGEDKEIAVTTAASKGVLTVERELAKCVVVCANCHRRIHAGALSLPAEAKTVRERFLRSPEARVSYGLVFVRRARPPTP